MTMLLRTIAAFGKIPRISLLVLFALVSPSMTVAQTIAVSEIEAPVDLNNPGNVTAKITRLSVEEAQGAIEKYLQGTIVLNERQGGEPAVTIEWFGLSSDAGGADTISLGPPLETAHEVTDLVIEKGTEVAVSGDTAALIRAAITLSQNEETPEVASEETSDGTSVSSTGTATQAGSGAAIDTTEAELPEMQAVTETETVETIVNNDVYGTTTDGCTPEISEDETTMHILERSTTNGEPTGECEQGLETATIKTTYIGCGYEIDLANNKAYAQSRRYYVYGGNSTDIDTVCETDTETAYTILETDKGCKVVPDLRPEYMVAKQFTALYFNGRENEPNDVEGCAARNGLEFPITLKLCGLRDDFDEKRSYEQVIATYRGEDGLSRNIGSCTDTTKFYVHHFDTSVCQPFADFTSNKLFEQYRVRIDISPSAGFERFRTPTCKPFSDALTDLQETQAGCESFHKNYDGYSRGGKRIIRKDNGMQVRECREADINYPHIYEPEGWVADDANLQAKPKHATYIMLPHPAGKTLVAAAVVRDGATEQTYTLVGTHAEDGGTEFVEGSCDKYLKQKKMETWRRPDGSMYVKQNGFGSSIGPSYACTAQISQTWNKVANGGTTRTCNGYYHYTDDGRNRSDCTGWTYTCSATYQGTRKLVREDGATVLETQHQHGYSGGVTSINAVCPNTVPYVQQWGINLGLL